MKTSVRSLSTVLGLAVMAPLAFAADNDNPVKKDQHVIIRHGDDFPPGPTSITFLGVETVPASRTLTEQLGLAPETGLVVNMVAPDSPAAAVLKPHDVLVKLDDQKLIETRQLAVLVRGHKEGDEVTLTYIRGGKEATAKVKLTKHDLPDMHHGSWQEESNQPWQRFAPGGDGLRRLGEVPALPREEMDRLLPLINMGRELHAEVIHPGVPGGGDPEVTSVNTSNSNMVLTDDAGIRKINATWREKDKPTNVLSFPAAPAPVIAASPMLGDIILAFETVEHEAAEGRLPLADHFVHLVVHGFLHLFGYDHQDDAEAEAMEALETRILAALGIADPYAEAPALRAAG